MKNIMKEAHRMAKEIKNEYPEVDYRFQLSLCLSYLYSQEEEKSMKVPYTGLEEVGKMAEVVSTQEVEINNQKVAIPEILEAEGKKFYVEANVWEKGSKHRIYFKGQLNGGCIDMMPNGTVRCFERGSSALIRGMQVAVANFMNGKIF